VDVDILLPRTEAVYSQLLKEHVIAEALIDAGSTAGNSA